MTVLQKSSIKAEISANLADNNTGNVTPALVRQVLTDITDSYQDGPALSLSAGQIPIAQSGGAPPTYQTVSGDATLNASGAISLANKQGALFGLTLSAAGSVATFGVASGFATDSTGNVIVTLPGSFSKTTGAWASGSGAGSLDTGAIAASTWYHVFLVYKPSGTVIDVLTSLSPTSPALPSGYSNFRRIGSLLTDGSNNWTAFTQNGDEFLWSTPVNNASNNNLTTTSVLFTVTVPTGVTVNALLRAAYENGGAAAFALIQSPAESTQAANTPGGNFNLGAATGVYTAGQFNIRTDTSARVRAVSSQAAGNSFYMVTYGWIDPRGRVN